jgi:cytochrome P450
MTQPRLDPFEIALRDDPHAAYRELRERAPVHEARDGYRVVTRHAEVSALLADARLGAGSGVGDSLGLEAGPLHELTRHWLMSLDGAAHRRVRRLISGVFTPRAAAALRPRIAAIAAQRVAALADDEPFDLIGALALPLPLEVMRLLFGVDADEWQVEVAALLGGGPAGPLQTMAPLADYFARLLARRRASPGADLLSALLTAELDGERLNELELVANAVLLVTAGFDTTLCSIGLGAWALLHHADQLARLRAEPGLWPRAVDELLRFETPALTTSRRALAPLEVAGVRIPAGAPLLLCLASANRDPARHADPNRLELTRPDPQPLAFGGGAHLCLGAALARVELEEALSALLGRFAQLELAAPRVRWRKDNPTIRGPERLELRGRSGRQRAWGG